MCVCCISDPPDQVTSLVFHQMCNDIITSWTVAPNQTCPITGYSVNISGVVIPVGGDQTSYTQSINDNVCGETLEISVSAISASGTGNATSTNITVVCTRKRYELTCLI